MQRGLCRGRAPYNSIATLMTNQTAQSAIAVFLTKDVESDIELSRATLGYRHKISIKKVYKL